MATRRGRVHAVHPLKRKALQADRSTTFAPVPERAEFFRKTLPSDSLLARLRETIPMPQ
jgi:hypothetical protein